MPVTNHPFFQAPVGSVYAIAIRPDKWGFVRFFRGVEMAVLSIVSDTPKMPDIDWISPPVGWIFTSFAPRNDLTPALRLGIVAFPDEASEWAPPCYVPPDNVDNCYKVHGKWGMVQRASEREVQGMRRCRTVTPAQLAEFLLEKFNAGELHLA